jgi:tRNA(Leu) C34 or U34 (ribose-2'-O)-methylase TrmL
MSAFAIGLEHVKNDVNVGGVLRAAQNFGASLVFTVGRRFKQQPSNTGKADRHLPVLNFETWDDYMRHSPYGWIPVAVELCDGATSLPRFVHPKQAVYLFGPEDGSICGDTLARCKYRVVIPSKFCLNLATASAVVMYDRLAKQQESPHA